VEEDVSSYLMTLETDRILENETGSTGSHCGQLVLEEVMDRL
jgi:hypothetical protein